MLFLSGQEVCINTFLIRYLVIHHKRLNALFQSIGVKYSVLEAVIEQSPSNPLHFPTFFGKHRLDPLETQPQLVGIFILLVSCHIGFDTVHPIPVHRPADGRL